VPSRQLADFVRCRDLTCRFPGCDEPAYHCDIDHTIAYPVGPTCASNLKCLCRKQVDLKTHDGRGTKSFGSTWIVLCRYLSGASAANGARHADNMAGMRRAARDH
jgi:hypothetical protein